MQLSRALQDKLLDIRLRDKLVAEGKLTKAQVDEFLKSLGDDDSNMTLTDAPSSASSSSENS